MGGGHGPLTRAIFSENVCENERIGLGGGVHPACPLDLPLNSVASAPFYTSKWAESTVKLPCSRRGNHEMYIASVTPYKIFLAGKLNN